MATSLRGVIDDTLINRFTGLAKGGTGASLANALTGRGDQTTIRDGLRTGARTFASAVQGLNAGISFLNVSRHTLTQLDEVTDKLLVVVEEATQSTTGKEKRHDLNTEFKKLGNEFQRIIEKADFGDYEYLTTEGIAKYLTVLGLDREKSESVSAVFKKFVLSKEDDLLASEEIQGERPTRVPTTAFGTGRVTSADFSSLFDEETNIDSRPNAYRVLNDLKALKAQITDNVGALDATLEMVGDNIALIRAAGFAFLNLSDQLKGDEDAADVALQLRDQIRRDAKGALAQAENLESVVVAALALNPAELGVKSKK